MEMIQTIILFIMASIVKLIESQEEKCPVGNLCSKYATCSPGKPPAGDSPYIAKYTCVCKTGYDGDGINCQEINECKNPKICPLNFVCINTPGSYKCLCRDGYYKENNKCLFLVDECKAGTHNCHRHAVCLDTVKSFACQCKAGYVGNGTYCKDIDECNSPSVCSKNATCTNILGSYHCSCVDGYFGDGKTCIACQKNFKGLCTGELISEVRESIPINIILAVCVSICIATLLVTLYILKRRTRRQQVDILEDSVSSINEEESYVTNNRMIGMLGEPSTSTVGLFYGHLKESQINGRINGTYNKCNGMHDKCNK